MEKSILQFLSGNFHLWECDAISKGQPDRSLKG
jgi:hypothetical protein